MRQLTIFAVFLLFAAASALEAAEVRNLRVWAGPDSTRAVLDLDQRVDYRLFTLDNPTRVEDGRTRAVLHLGARPDYKLFGLANPDRVVIDIKGMELEHALELDLEHSGVIRSVRHGVRDGTDLRVVLDLSSQARPQSFLLDPAGEYGHRLVVDL